MSLWTNISHFMSHWTLSQKTIFLLVRAQSIVPFVLYGSLCSSEKDIKKLG